MIKINLSSVVHAREGYQESRTLDIPATALNDIKVLDLYGDLLFTRIAYGILVEGVLKAKAKTECTRCLIPIENPISFELEDEQLGLPGADITPEQPVRVTDDDWADLAPLFREYAWLALPASPVCSEDCKGICPTCGGNRNLGECTCDDSDPIDPRWEALRALKESVQQDLE